MNRAFDAVYGTSTTYDVHMRTAALVRAIDRVAEFTRLAGDLPIVVPVNVPCAARVRGNAFRRCAGPCRRHAWREAVRDSASHVGCNPWNPIADPEEHRRVDRPRSIWTAAASCCRSSALIAVVSFGSGIVAERYLFGGSWLGSGRLSGGLSGDDGNPESDAAFPRQAEVRRFARGRVFLPPGVPGGAGHVLGRSGARRDGGNGGRGGDARRVAGGVSPRARLRRGAAA